MSRPMFHSNIPLQVEKDQKVIARDSVEESWYWTKHILGKDKLTADV